MAKSDLQIFVDMNLEDIRNNTATLGISPHLVRADMKGKNGQVTMGCEPETIHKLMNGDVITVLLIIDRKAYKKHKEG